MKCPNCNSLDDMVVDSRPYENFSIIKRRRECINCKKRFTTYERLEILSIVIVKKDGTKEIFDRNKVRNGILTACRKRPISIEKIDSLVTNIEYEIQEIHGEIPTRLIGNKIMEKLKKIDEVAYLRFASVYQEFENLDIFLDEIKNLNLDSKKEGMEEK